MPIQDRVLAAAVSHLLAYRARPAAIRRAVPSPTPSVVPSPSSVLSVAAAQMRFEFVENGAQYAKKIYALAAQAAQQGAQLVAFPEYAWTPLIGMLPNIRALERNTGGGLQGAASTGGASLRDILLLVAPHVERAFAAAGSAVARALKIYLMNGSTVARDANGKLFNVAYLFAPDGSLLGTQKKLHPFTSEREWLTAGSELNVFDIGSTRVATPVCMDFTYWETTRLAWQRGAEILINPSADDYAEQEFLQARGVRTRVQEVPCYGILANMVTDLFGLHWRGPSMIVQPCALGNSIIAQAQTTTQQEIVVAQLDLAKLRAYRAQQHWDFHRALLSEILPRAYTAEQK